MQICLLLLISVNMTAIPNNCFEINFLFAVSECLILVVIDLCTWISIKTSLVVRIPKWTKFKKFQPKRLAQESRICFQDRRLRRLLQQGCIRSGSIRPGSCLASASQSIKGGYRDSWMDSHFLTCSEDSMM